MADAEKALADLAKSAGVFAPEGKGLLGLTGLSAVLDVLAKASGALAFLYSLLHSTPANPVNGPAEQSPDFQQWQQWARQHAQGGFPAPGLPTALPLPPSLPPPLPRVGMPPHLTEPVPVRVVGGQLDTRVTNGKDLADGVSKHQAKQLQRNPSGPTGHNLSRGYLPPAMAMPTGISGVGGQ